MKIILKKVLNIVKHQVEMEKKEEENQKKYNEALARKENEIKKKIKILYY